MYGESWYGGDLDPKWYYFMLKRPFPTGNGQKWVSKCRKWLIHSHFLHQKSAINTCSLHKYGTSYYGGLQDPKEPFPAQEMIKCGQLSAGKDYSTPRHADKVIILGMGTPQVWDKLILQLDDIIKSIDWCNKSMVYDTQRTYQRYAYALWAH